MKNRILLILVVFGFASCNPTYYMPNNVNVPLLKEKGETVAQGHIGSAEEFRETGVNVAHAIGRNSALMLNLSSFKSYPDLSEYSGDTTVNNLHFNKKNQSFMAEIGAGFFKPFGPDSIFVFETYAGYGMYTMNRALNTYQSVAYNIHRPFVQPSISIRYKIVEVSYGLRMSMLFFSNQHPSTAFVEDEITMMNFENWNKIFNIDHSLTIGVGAELVKFQIQWIYNPQVNYLNDSFLIPTFSNVNIGLKFRFQPF
ncbi:MAG: hypothetical protein PHW91_11375 [Bacteroidales bacterium]|nr:hypothetical protein [Bacteroidales bacterium]